MCTRALWPAAPGAVLVGRNMDWADQLDTYLWAFPQGMSRDDGVGRKLTWRSRYGSLVASAYDLMTVDGFNEAGLGAHQLFLPESHYGTPDGSRTTLSLAVWMQYVLDNFAAVADAVSWIAETQLQIVEQRDPFSGSPLTLHLGLEDASGDPAIIEYLDGTPNIHHDRSYTVMTNSPPFAEQLERLRQIQGLGGNAPLPGGTDADHRFARAAYYLQRLPAPASPAEAIASILSVIRNAAQPFRIPDPDKPFASQTQWATVLDLTNRLYVFESKHHPNIVWVRMDGLNLSSGASACRLDLVNGLTLEEGLVGDVTDRFVETSPMEFLKAS